MDNSTGQPSAPSAEGSSNPHERATLYDVTACIARTLGRQYLAVYHVWMEDRSYVAFREGLDSVRGEIETRGDAEEAFATYISNYIEPEDRLGMRAFVSFDTLAERLLHRDVISHECRRLGLGWTRYRFLVSNRDEDGNARHVIFVVSDITDERMLAAKEGVASYSSRHDILTGALNCNAFEETTSSSVCAGEQTGFALIDIDCLKLFNDEHGHGFGDEVLSKVAAAMKNAFRSDDLIFRVGGDEFAVIMKNCRPSNWGAICEKFERIHRSLSLVAPEGGDITLSAGICFGPSGYEDWMYSIADKGLYHTKKTGCAGCTLMNRNGSVADTWRDSEATIRPFAALAGTSSGMGRIEVPRDNRIRPRFFCGDGLKALYGIPDGLSPEDRYEFWWAGVDEAYRETLTRAHREMITNNNVECTFLWGRDGRQPFYVRSVGAGKVEGEMDVVFGLHRSLEGAHLVEHDNKASLVIKAQNRAFVCSYIADLQNDTLTVIKQSPTAWSVDIEGLNVRDSLAALTRKLVCGKDMERLLAFLDTDTLTERLGEEVSLTCEYKATTDAGWCRGTWLPIEFDASGNLASAMLTVASIDSAKQKEMQHERELAESMSLHYNAAETMLGTKILSIALFDRETGAGRAWTKSRGFLNPISIDYECLVEKDMAYVEEEDRPVFLRALRLEHVASALASEQNYEITQKRHLANGEARYLTYHFTEYAQDPALLFAVVEDSTAIHDLEGRSVEDLYNNAPGGLVSYEWDGTTLTPVHISNSYRRLFDVMSGAPATGKGLDFDRIHPEDVEGYKREVLGALKESQEVHHIYRILNAQRTGYVWAKVDAVVKTQADGGKIAYAMYSDVSEMVKTRLKLLKTSTSLASALKASNQMIWEYDPESHIATCYTEDNAFGLPKVIEHYPESLKHFGIFPSEDSELFAETVRKIDEGAEQANCLARILVNGEPRWFRCEFYARFDPVLGKRIATLFINDVNVSVTASKAFKKRMESLLYSKGNALSIGVYNISAGEVLEVHARKGVLSKTRAKYSYAETLNLAAAGIIDPADKQKYLETFSRKNLISLANAGESSISMECLYQIEPGHTEWMEVSVDLVVDPITGEVDGIGSVVSVNELRLSNMLIQQSLKHSYNSSAVLLNNGDEYYLYDSMTGNICTHHVDYWGDLRKVLKAICSEEELKRIEPKVSKEAVLKSLAAGSSTGTAFDSTFHGKRYRLELRFAKSDEHEGMVFAMMRDITDSAMLMKLRHDSRHDSLTGLYNRTTTFKRCEQLLQDYPDVTFAMLKLNVRRFRLFNAFFGEKAGDNLLKSIASQLRKAFEQRPDCAFGRLESDIFCVFFPFDDKFYPLYLEVIEKQFANYTSDFPLEPSIGIYVVTDRSLPAEGMFARATSAAKEGGTKLSRCARRYNDMLDHKLRMELTIANEMHSALDQEQFAVYLQPKFNLQNGAIAGAEALVRWIHPKRGVVSPGEFIPVFERNGFITSLDRYMWEHVCKLLRTWTAEGRDVKPVSVNVSRVSAYNPTTVAFLKDLVSRYEVDPKLMELELTESAYMEDPDEVMHNMHALQEAGFQILMDDFGSGYSSLNTLRSLSVDVLKLDIGFLSDTCDDERSRAVIDSVLAMTNRLNIPVIAEGVENQKQADYLRGAGCTYVQGYLFARPMPVSEYEKLS